MVSSKIAELESYGSLSCARTAMKERGRRFIYESNGVELLLELLRTTTHTKTQVHAGQALLNLSLSDFVQEKLGRIGLYTLIEVSWSPTCEEVRQIISGIMHNISINPKNRSPLYRAELHIKATLEAATKKNRFEDSLNRASIVTGGSRNKSIKMLTRSQSMISSSHSTSSGFRRERQRRRKSHGAHAKSGRVGVSSEQRNSRHG